MITLKRKVSRGRILSKIVVVVVVGMVVVVSITTLKTNSLTVMLCYVMLRGTNIRMMVMLLVD